MAEEVLFTPRISLPASMLRDIGRLIVRYAYIDHGLQMIIYDLMGIEHGVGRLAVREPGRLTDKLDLALDLMSAKKIAIPDGIDTKLLRASIEEVMDMRNLCAHSTWSWSEKQNAWEVIVMRGQWAGVPKAERARRSKKLFPEGQIVRPEKLKLFVAGVDAIERHLRHLHTTLAAQRKEQPQTRP